jgi:hypothetical protein
VVGQGLGDDAPREGTELYFQRQIKFNHIEPPIAW